MRIYFVSHTHWDREWYLTREKSRTLLVKLMDELFWILEENPDFTFMLDGQTIALQDYLEVVPEKRGLLQRHVASGRISIGPWYVLPDELLVSGKSHIRNYLAGQRLCRELGGSMQTGYLPDSIGHPSQMPQILAGLGIREMIFWRGLGPGTTRTEILGVNTPFSYSVAACMPENPDAFVQRLRLKIDMLAPLTDGNVLLLMNGVDHVAPQRSFAGNLRHARARIAEHELIHGGLADCLAALRAQLLGQEWLMENIRTDAFSITGAWTGAQTDFENAFEAGSLGCAVEFPDDDIPWVGPGQVTSDVDLRTLEGMDFVHSGLNPALTNTSDGPFGVAGDLMGQTELFTAVHERPDFLKELLRIVTDKLITYLDFCWEEEKRLRDHFGGRASLHMCGRTDHLLEIFRDDLRIDEYQGFGYEVYLHKIASVMGGRVVLLGNVNPMLVHRGPPEAIRAAVRTCIEALAPLKGYIVQDSANIPPGTPPEHINAMMEAAETWGRYRQRPRTAGRHIGENTPYGTSESISRFAHSARVLRRLERRTA